MESKKDVFEKGKSVRDMHHLRLMSLLQELERDHGRKKAAEVLGVDRRTLDASLDDGVLSRRIRGQLEKALQSGVGSAAAEQRDRNDKLEDRLEDVEGRLEQQGKEIQVSRRAQEDGGAGRAGGGGAGASQAGTDAVGAEGVGRLGGGGAGRPALSPGSSPC